MTQETLTLAILFADIAKSTHLYETLGDKIAQTVIASCLSVLSEVTVQHQGSVIKTMGDEIMCAFPTANDAVEAAMDMHEAIGEISIVDMPDFRPPNIYVGIHLGPVIREGDDVFGDSVNVAARVVALANQRQITITEQTVKALIPEHQTAVHYMDKTTVPGKSGEISIYEVIWERLDLTVEVTRPTGFLALQSCMELRYGDHIIMVDKDHPDVTLGRQSHNDLVVDDNRVSRSHCRIEYRRGKFVLIDQSTNGTYVIVQGKKGIILKRDEAPLYGNGTIVPGGMVNSDSTKTIEYAIKL